MSELERQIEHSAQFAIDNPGFRLSVIGWKLLHVADGEGTGVYRLPCVTVLHVESGQTFEDWGDSFAQAITLALLNLRTAMDDDVAAQLQ